MSIHLYEASPVPSGSHVSAPRLTNIDNLRSANERLNDIVKEQQVIIYQ